MPRILSVLLAATLGFAYAEEKSQELTAEQVPAAVMATMVKAANGGKLSDFEQEVKAGKTVYTAEIKDAAGKELEVEVAADGTLVSVAAEDDDKDGDKKEDENGHGHQK